MRQLRSSGSVGGVVRPSGRAALSRKQPTSRARPGKDIDETSLIGAAVSGIVVGASCCEASNTPDTHWCSLEPV
jgi:hypothetical protein